MSAFPKDHRFATLSGTISSPESKTQAASERQQQKKTSETNQSHQQSKWRKALVILNWTMIVLSTWISLFPIFLTSLSLSEGRPVGYFAHLLANTTYTSPIDTATQDLLTDDAVHLNTNVSYAMLVGKTKHSSRALKQTSLISSPPLPFSLPRQVLS